MLKIFNARKDTLLVSDNTLSKFKPNPYIQNMSPASNDTINKEMTINEIVNGIEVNITACVYVFRSKEDMSRNVKNLKIFINLYNSFMYT